MGHFPGTVKTGSLGRRGETKVQQQENTAGFVMQEMVAY